jgi:uncharacterized protein YndB with AHSA1/START domain
LVKKSNMVFQNNPNQICWRLHLKSPPEKVYQALSTDAGRASFWAESAVAQDGIIHFVFPNRMTWNARILEAIPASHYAVQYIGNSITTFSLEEDGQGGTDLTLTDEGVPVADRTEVIAGWVSVLLALKASVDFSVDLRTHDTDRQWDHGYAEN